MIYSILSRYILKQQSRGLASSCVDCGIQDICDIYIFTVYLFGIPKKRLSELSMDLNMHADKEPVLIFPKQQVGFCSDAQ